MTELQPGSDDLIGSEFGPYVVQALQESMPQISKFMGQHRHSRQAVTIRVVAPDYAEGLRDSFLIEKEKLREFDHPHILPLLAAGEEHGRLYTVTPEVTGGDLRARLSEELLPYREVLRLTRELGWALDYAHRRGALHGNLRPESVLMDGYGNLYLTNFGLPLTPPGPYSAPEHWRGDDLNARSDIYALGVLLYEMITGQVPFRAAEPEALMHQHLAAVPPLPVRPDEPAGFVNEEPVFRALTKKPSRRFASAPALAAAFEKTLAGRITRNTMKALPLAADHERASELSPRWLPTGATPALTNSVSDVGNTLNFDDGETAITGCAMLPGGADFVFSTDDGRILRWDSGAESPGEIVAAESPIFSLSMSDAGERLLTTHADGSAEVRELSGALLHRLTGHTGPVACGAISANGLVAITGGADGALRVWDLLSGEERLQIDAHQDDLLSCSLSDNGQLALTGGADGALYLWNATTGEQMQSFSGHASPVTACQLKGELVFSGGQDGELRVWDILMEDVPLIIKGHTDAVTAVAVQEVGAMVQGVSCSEDGSIGIWDLRSGAAIARFEPEVGPLRCCDVNGRRLVCGSGSGGLHINTLPQPIDEVEGHARRAVDVSVSKQTIFSVSINGAIRQTDAERGRVLNEVALKVIPQCLEVSPDYVFVGTLDGLLKCYDRTSFRLRWEASAHESALRFITVVDERRVVSGGADGMLALWNTVNGARLSAVALKTGGLRCGVQADGLVVVGSQEGQVAAWDVMTGAQRQLYGEFLAPATACAIQQDFVIAGFVDGAIYRWPLASEEAELGFQAHSASITALAAHPDQRTLLSADSSGTVAIWDVESQIQLDEWRPPAPITAACWADEHHVILCDEAGGISALNWLPASQ